MKNPNGYGSVVKLSGSRRKPFCARRTIGWNIKGHPIYRNIGYYATRKEGIIALAEYNKNPYDLNYAKLTMAELYTKWSERDFPKMAKATYQNLRCTTLHMKHVIHSGQCLMTRVQIRCVLI